MAQRITGWVAAVIGAVWGSSSFAEVALDRMFSDSMVLQRAAPLSVYGSGSENETVTVAFNGARATASVLEGRWKVTLPPMKAGGPFTLSVVAKNTITLTNVLVGDVWVCAGQSNMATLLKLYKGDAYKAYGRLFEGVPRPNDQLRLFKVKRGAADTPQREVVASEEFGGWRPCDEQSAMDFSALGYLFGSKLQRELAVPVGVIHAAVGGTWAECWVSLDTLQGKPELQRILEEYELAKQNYPAALKRFEEAAKEWQATPPEKRGGMKEPVEPMGPNHVKRPTGLYNYMIAPLQQFAIKGVIWYQGEGNVSRPVQYRTLFPALIDSWRRQWGSPPSPGGAFPFLFVQLAAFDKVAPEPEDPDWAWLREAQAMALSLPDTGMAVAIDAGHQTNIHPPYKPQLAERLVAAALKVAYGRDSVASGPSFRRMTVRDNKAVLEFDNSGSGLVGKALELEGGIHLSTDELKGFALCGDDRVFRWASAVIEGDTVVVSHPVVARPVAVRYGWARFPVCNLYNKEGFPATPFRTDRFTQQTGSRRNAPNPGRIHTETKGR